MLPPQLRPANQRQIQWKRRKIGRTCHPRTASKAPKDRGSNMCKPPMATRVDLQVDLHEQCTQVAHGLVRIMAHAIMVPTSPCSPPTNPHLMFFAENVAMTSAQTGATSKFVWLPHRLVGSCSNPTLLSGNLPGIQAVAASAIHWICRSFSVKIH